MSQTLLSHSIFIFDANFFISLKEIKANAPYSQLALVKKKLEVDFYCSGQVFNECGFIQGQDFRTFSQAVEIALVKDEDIEKVKQDLQRKNIRSIAQDNDISLVALGKSLLGKEKADIFIVSDDFKLAQNIETLGYSIRCLPLPGFLQMLGQSVKGDLRTYWKIVRKQVLKLNLDYMMSRSDIYAPQAKIAWFIENSIDIAGIGINLRENKEFTSDNESQNEKLAQDHQILEICENSISQKTVPKDKAAQITVYQFALDRIREQRAIIKSAKDAIIKNDFTTALKYLRQANESLIQTFQLGGAHLPETNYQVFEKLMASEISKSVFLKAYVLIESNKITSALDALDQTALFTTVARIPSTVLAINYLKGLLYIFNSLYNKAIQQFEFNMELTDNLKVERNLGEILKLKAMIGGAITNFLIDQPEKAFDLIQREIPKYGDKSLPNLMTALLDSGDYFLAMGFPEIASNLFSEALECAVDSQKSWKTNIILTKMKKAYMASALLGTQQRPSADISVLIDKFHTLRNTSQFNELISELATFTNKFYEPVEFFTAGKKTLISFYDLPAQFREDWECVKIQENPETQRTILVGFHESLGLLGFDVLLDTPLEGIPEHYVFHLKSTAKVRIDPPDEARESLFLIRGIVKTSNEDRDIEISRKIPVFFTQMQI